MAYLFELIATVIIFVATKPFSLCKSACTAGVRTVAIVIHTWIELVQAAIVFHLNLFWRALILFVALITLPMRVLSALQKERLLEQHVHDMHTELENMVWDMKELQDRLRTALKERKIMELMLAEVEDENDKAVEKIELLKGELQNLKHENIRLKEIIGKELWSFRGHGNTGVRQDIDVSNSSSCGIARGIPSWNSSNEGSDIVYQDPMMERDSWDNQSKTEMPAVLSTKSSDSGPIRPFTANFAFRNLDTDYDLHQRRAVALSQSLFSAVLSLLVGIVIWHAEDPCMPLVVALFTIVGMSLKSVVQFFSTINNKPASDAVALLSFNCFILGTLTYPTLPRFARMLAPLALSLVNRQ
ncbi:uncharacterized protein LOC120017086 [Tripterygium wilfordii]|uniref:uncharacterized protein LOC120017086 n=1 Tax=Tripterygium wilfordii TaxID=458696 RepID=UPI0018F7EB2E|nr:uncharacterized protein LOC120017086 [Tripterygium wilfordii]XP_038726083.1 uncharacterized protein LOC120017086 [Tripterygium wilfordii]